MKNYSSSKELLSMQEKSFLPSVSIDCMILGFNEGVVQILLNKFKGFNSWMLPGGFVHLDESINDAAVRILYNRTTLENCYLKQFYTFGDVNRVNSIENERVLNASDINNTDGNHWILRRFISVGYYALVDYHKIEVRSNEDEDIAWFPLNKIPSLYADHSVIINKGIKSLKTEINYLPVGIDLLPEKFTMRELRRIYETILGKGIDRRNFQRKILSSGLVYKLDEVSKRWGVKDTALFSFDKEKYIQALEDGISLF